MLMCVFMCVCVCVCVLARRLLLVRAELRELGALLHPGRRVRTPILLLRFLSFFGCLKTFFSHLRGFSGMLKKFLPLSAGFLWDVLVHVRYDKFVTAMSKRVNALRVAEAQVHMT